MTLGFRRQPHRELNVDIIDMFKNMFMGKKNVDEKKLHDKTTKSEKDSMKGDPDDPFAPVKQAGEPGTTIEKVPDEKKDTSNEHSEISHPKLKVVMARLNEAMPEEEDGPVGRMTGFGKT